MEAVHEGTGRAGDSHRGIDPAHTDPAASSTQLHREERWYGRLVSLLGEYGVALLLRGRHGSDTRHLLPRPHDGRH